jgi:HAD superfamily hydrolase (TIGR01549 family)
MKCVVFDFDGTLIDSKSQKLHSIKSAFEDMGINLTLSDKEIIYSKGLSKYNLSENWIKLLLFFNQNKNINLSEILNDPRAEEIIDNYLNFFNPDSKLIKKIHEKYKKYKEDYGYLSELFPYVIDTLEQLKKLDVHICIYSNNNLDFIKKKLDYLKSYFDLIITPKHGYKKPNPEGILYICNKLNIDLEDTIMVGDTLLDFDTARNASIMFSAVTSGLGYEKILRYYSNYVFRNTYEFALNLENLFDDD